MSKRTGQKAAARMVRDEIARERRRRRTLWTSVVAVIALAIAGMIGYVVYSNQRPHTYTAPPGAVDDASGIAVGTGPVKLDLYEDFICPACRQFEQQGGATVDQLIAANKVTLIYHPVAYLDRFSSTRYSTRSSAASACAAEGGKYREYARALFERQPPEGGAGLSDDELISIGSGIGLGDTFGRCVRDGKYTAWTAHVTDAASKRGVIGTPSAYVNGKPTDSNPQAITAAVDAAGK
ncbi:Protein-disulfide isomerase [Micromonospora pattaloongensis]|uniref:Protein-disulfide isomerase n=1 Tax=Micromonospora pattaloongensis TaxID=405436 RepID=A0A1H3FQF4_9ACTN|nr:thioredoxin domain-containing protein [Micromonospora pattaloongensis]SDX93171.1 Protein-disulfide isomerase [Micromonospora pattaloongensis]